jgi:amino acid transporter
MSESPPNLEEKDPKTYAAPETSSDVENGDRGIVVKANPLSRELKGRHMQMIAIGMYLDVFPSRLALSLTIFDF